MRTVDWPNKWTSAIPCGSLPALAMEMRVPCVTEDGELQEKFPAVAVGMKDFVDRSFGTVREARALYRAHKGGRKSNA
jgi:hypothetical protein